MKKLFLLLVAAILVGGLLFGFSLAKYLNENKVLREVVSRLEADSRIAQVLVTKVRFDEESAKTLTTIKFLEYDWQGQPLAPRYFTFSGNIIQFQALVIRFDDIHIRNKDSLRGRSAYLFWKAFMLDGPRTQEFEITEASTIPQGYKIKGLDNPFERELWERFWSYALDSQAAEKMGIKNAQIEAPGTMFIPGTIYTIKIEHDGGIRIDASPIPTILKGEHIL